MKRVAVVQARMGSSRLPGKTLMVAAGKPLLQHLIERLARASRLDGIGVATTVNPEDDAIEALCHAMGVGCYRGSAEDVLGRVTAAVEAFGAGVHVEIHGDGPLADWRVIDRAVATFEAGGYDLVTNSLVVTYPPGLEVWVYAASTLHEVEREARAARYRESPALFLTECGDRYRLCNLEAPPELHRPNIYLEVDTATDFEVLRTILEALYSRNPALPTEDVLGFLDAHPALAERNRHVERRWKRP
jgi:spore coat polysaccharide biosynthesis protein SpsF